MSKSFPGNSVSIGLTSREIKRENQFEGLYLKSLDDGISTSLKLLEIKSIDEELNETEETFRDANLLIESIRELNLKQKKAIYTIKFQLD